MSLQAVLDEAELAYASDDLSRARGCYLQVLESAPAHEIASRALAELDRQIMEAFPSDASVELVVSLGDLVRQAIPPKEAFALSRLAVGGLTVSDLERACGANPIELRFLLHRWVANGVVLVTASP